MYVRRLCFVCAEKRLAENADIENRTQGGAWTGQNISPWLTHTSLQHFVKKTFLDTEKCSNSPGSQCSPGRCMN